MNLQVISVARLKPAPYNPRVALKPGSDGYRRLERSLKEFSLIQPIVWNEVTGHVVGGHQRLQILMDQGVEEIDCVVVSLPLEREKALNVTLNNQQVGSDWDTDKLVTLIEELDTLPDFDATLTGFDEKDLNDLLLTPDPEFVEEKPTEDGEDVVQVVIEVPTERWESLRGEFDRLIGEHGLTVHVRTPG